jgi:hypothetical protein
MIVRALLCLSIIIAGLALRGFGLGLGLPALVVKYGGSMLWGTMVFFLVAISASTLSRPMIALISVLIAIGVELFRLVHFPWLDGFRLTLAGALLLGRIFSLWACWLTASESVWRRCSTISSLRNSGNGKPLTPRAETARSDRVPRRCGA